MILIRWLWQQGVPDGIKTGWFGYFLVAVVPQHLEFDKCTGARFDDDDTIGEGGWSGPAYRTNTTVAASLGDGFLIGVGLVTLVVGK